MKEKEKGKRIAENTSAMRMTTKKDDTGKLPVSSNNNEDEKFTLNSDILKSIRDTVRETVAGYKFGPILTKEDKIAYAQQYVDNLIKGCYGDTVEAVCYEHPMDENVICVLLSQKVAVIDIDINQQSE